MNLWERINAIFAPRQKALRDLHPELRDREPLLRVWSDDDTRSGEYADAAGDYTRNVWVHKAVKVIADNIAPLRLRVVRGEEDDEVVNHPLPALLSYVNGTMTGVDLWEQWTLNMLLGGECGFELVRNARRQYAEVWPRTPSQFSVRVSRELARYNGIVGYKIDDGFGEPYDLPTDEFVHFKFHNPLSPWRGLAPLTAVRMGILIDEYAQAWARTFFKNSTRPDFAVIAPQGLTNTEREAIIAKLEERNGGLGGAHRPIVLEQGVTDIKPFSFPPKDIEWLKQREFSREEIGGLFGVPDEIMGWGRDTYENFGMAMRVFWQITLVPILDKRDGQLTEFFQRTGDLRADERFDTDLSEIQALQEDRGQLIAQAQQLFAMGVPVAEINKLLGLGISDKISGLDVGYLPTGLIPVTRVGGPAPERPSPAQAEQPTEEPTEEPEEEPREEDEPQEEEPQPEPEQRALTRSEPRIPFGSLQHKAMWLLFKARTETFEGDMKRMLKREFQEQQNRVARKVRDGATTIDSVFDAEAERVAWRKAFRKFYQVTVGRGGDHGVEQAGALGISFDVNNPRVQRMIETLLWDFTDEVTQTTQEALRELLIDASEEGLSISDISDKIAELYDGFKGPRSETIARTETIRCYNAGTLEGYVQSGVKVKGWLSALDERTRTPPKSEFDHVAAHGEEVGINDPFERTGEKLQYPGDPTGSPGNTINCRCTEYPVVED